MSYRLTFGTLRVALKSSGIDPFVAIRHIFKMAFNRLFRLGYIWLCDCPAGKSPPRGVEIGEKLL